MHELESNAWIPACCLQWMENQLKEECKMFHENIQTWMASPTSTSRGES
jgi:hypothetical protein